MNKVVSVGSYHLFLKKWVDRSSFYKYKHFYSLPKATYAPWLEDREFMNVFEKVKNNTLVDIYRCYELWHLVKQTNHLQGDIIEIGVWKGGTASILASALSRDSIIYLCDTFTGVVKASSKDNQYKGGEHADTTEELVVSLFKTIGLSNFSILKGIFPEETGELIQAKKIRFCHIDVDVYQSAKDIFLWVWERMEIGGTVVFDDYGFAACEGITNLVNDELSNRTDLIMCHNLNGHAILVKTGA